MAKWIAIDKTTNRVKSVRESRGDAPASTVDIEIVPDDDGSLADDWRAKQAQMGATGRSQAVEWNGSAFEIPADTRHRLVVTCNRAADAESGAVLLEGNGSDSITLTVTVNDKNDQKVNFTGQRAVQVDHSLLGRISVGLSFVNGVASRSFSSTKIGTLQFLSTDQYEVLSPVVIEITA